MPADRTSVSTGKLCPLFEMAIGFMILTRSPEWRRRDQGRLCCHHASTWGALAGGATPMDGASLVAAARQRGCRPARRRTYGLREGGSRVMFNLARGASAPLERPRRTPRWDDSDASEGFFCS